MRRMSVRIPVREYWYETGSEGVSIPSAVRIGVPGDPRHSSAGCWSALELPDAESQVRGTLSSEAWSLHGCRRWLMLLLDVPPTSAKAKGAMDKMQA